MKSILRGLNYLFALLLICVAIFLAYIAIPAFGNKALIVRSGSMEPTIKTGDLIVVRIASGITSPLPNVISKYKVGDTIAFKEDKNPNVLTTHKIVTKKIVDGKTMYQTQGDANKTPDIKLIAEEQIVGKSIFTLPKVGKLFAYAKTKQGFALLVLIPALLVILIESTNLIKELFKINRARRMLQADPISDMESGNLLGPVGLRVLMPIVVSLMFFHNSYAFFSDSATSLSNTFTAASVFPSPTPTPTPSPSPSPSSTPIATPSPSPSPTNIADHVVISEVQIAGTIADDDFIELYNPTSVSISLSGHRLVKRTSSGSSDENIVVFSSTDSMAAHSYLLWCNSGFTTLSCNKTSGDTLSNNNSIALRNGVIDVSAIIDAVTFGTPANPLGEGTSLLAPVASSSIERKANSTSTSTTMALSGTDEFKGNGFDLDNNSTDFVSRTISEPQNISSPPETP